MAIFEVEKDGKVYEVDAPSMEAAAAAMSGGESVSSARPGGMSVFNEGIARGLGGPVDMVTGAVNAGISGVNAVSGSEFGHIEDPIGGAGTMRDLFRSIGIDMPEDDYQPEGVMENLVLGTGAAAGGLGPFLGVGKAMQAGTGLTKAAGDAMLQPFASTPVRAVASELAAGAGSGVGVDVADQLAPDNPLAQMAGALVGGAAGGAGTYAATHAAAKMPGISAATRFAQSEFAPFTEAGAMERARNRMANLVEDPEAARAAIAQPTIGNLSPAVSTADTRLMALEQTVRDTDPAVDLRMRQMEAEGADALRQEIVAPANGQDSRTARTFMEGAVQQQVDGVGQSLNQAFGEPSGINTTSTRLRTESAPARRSAYDDAYEAPINYATDAGANLQGLVARVEQTAPGAIALANRLMAGEGLSSHQIKANIADDGSVSFEVLPDTRQLDYITRAMNQMAESGEGQGQFGGQTDLGRVISGLSRNIRTNLKSANPLYANALETAATPMGQRQALLFGQELLKPSLHRDVAAERIADMTGPEVEFVRQGVRAQLDETLANVRATIANPDTGLREAQRALGGMSTRAVRQKVGMILPKEEADAFFAELDAVTGMIDPSRSGVALVASARPGEEIKSLLNAPDPGAAAVQLIEQAGTDPTGNTLSGIKGGFLDELMTRARSGFDDQGEALLSGRAMQNALSDKRMMAVGNAVLSVEERSRLSSIVEELTKLETARGRLPSVGKVMEGEPNSLVSMFARTIAARLGAHAGRGTSGASLLTANIASQRMKRLLETLTLDKAEALIRQAVAGDKELFDALLTPADRITPKQEGYLANILSNRGPGTAAGTVGGGNAAMDEEQPVDPVMDLIQPSAPLRIVVDGAGTYSDDEAWRGLLE